MKHAQILRLAVICTLTILSLCGNSFAIVPCLNPIGITPAGPFSISGSGGSGSYTVNTGGNNAGTSCHWDTLPLSFITVSQSFGGGGSTFIFPVNFTVLANPNLAPRSASITVRQTEDDTTATVVVNQAASSGDFAVAVAPGSQNIMQGGTATYTVTISRSGGFAGAITLRYSGPAGTSASFSPNGTLGTSSTMTVLATASA